MSNKKNEKSYLGLISVIISIIIISAWILTYFLLKDKQNAGTIGDMFGSINALFSGLALAGIILSILLQRNELKLQREELQETRLEFQTQNITLGLQRFENTFFNLLNLHHQIVSNIEKTYTRTFTSGITKTKENTIYKGRDLFSKEYGIFLEGIENQKQNYQKVYDRIYTNSISVYGHYFRNLYRIIKLVDEAEFSKNKELDFEEKYKYISILRAQLSDYEMAFVFYNCLHPNGIEKFKPLVEKYTFFNNINDLLIHEEHKVLFAEKAYVK